MQCCTLPETTDGKLAYPVTDVECLSKPKEAVVGCRHNGGPCPAVPRSIALIWVKAKNYYAGRYNIALIV